MVLKRYAAALAVSTALTFIVPAGADASTYETSTTAIRVGDVSFYKSETFSDNMRFAHVLSSHYNRPVLTSEVIRLQADFDFGFGNISLMYAVADYSGLPIDDVLVLRRKNMGWGEIAKLHGLKVQELKRRHDLFVDYAHVNGVNINYIEIEDYDRKHDVYHEADRDKDKKHDEPDRKQVRNNDERNVPDRNQDRNNNKQHQDKGDKKDNKKVYGQNNDKDNGHKQ
ncbi:hypothetical protein [Sporomusa sp.]|uniref:hypothetical protein n=1 Tax=Sporomusa sp. TaxID=2078658 RepID=UPI002CB72702|nr:hypothetical protein [Sporomusa sp.]HWR43965.1 hypothetical protein [Sporomusa sp.]